MKLESSASTSALIWNNPTKTYRDSSHHEQLNILQAMFPKPSNLLLCDFFWNSCVVGLLSAC